MAGKPAAKKKPTAKPAVGRNGTRPTRKDEDRPLDYRERLFVQEYLIDLDVERAAIAANYSATMAKSKAYQWVGGSKITKPWVAKAIRLAMEKREKKTGVTQERVLQELARVGFSDLRGMFSETGALKRPGEWSDDVAGAVSSVEVVTRNAGEGEVEHVAKLRMWDKVSALEKIAKHLGMLTDKVDVAVSMVRVSADFGDSDD